MFSLLREMWRLAVRMWYDESGNIVKMFTPPKSQSIWEGMTGSSTGGWAKGIQGWGPALTAAAGAIPIYGPFISAGMGAMGTMNNGTGFQGTDKGWGNLGSTAMGGLQGWGMGSLGAMARGGIMGGINNGWGGILGGLGRGAGEYMGATTGPFKSMWNTGTSPGVYSGQPGTGNAAYTARDISNMPGSGVSYEQAMKMTPQQLNDIANASGSGLAGSQMGQLGAAPKIGPGMSAAYSSPYASGGALAGTNTTSGAVTGPGGAPGGGPNAAGGANSGWDWTSMFKGGGMANNLLTGAGMLGGALGMKGDQMYDMPTAEERYNQAMETVVGKYLGPQGLELPRRQQEEYLKIINTPFGEMYNEWMVNDPRVAELNETIDRSYDDALSQLNQQAAQSGGFGGGRLEASDLTAKKQELTRLAMNEKQKGINQIQYQNFKEGINVKLEALRAAFEQGQFNQQLAMDLAKLDGQDAALQMALEQDNYDAFQQVMGQIFMLGYENNPKVQEIFGRFNSGFSQAQQAWG